ncbi:MAG: hypothetical protein WBE76_00335 [Terracidiphilus sp.]
MLAIQNDEERVVHVEPACRELEAVVDQEIAQLWSAQRDYAATAGRTRDELKSIRATLAERLHAMKSLLVQTGRGGQWASYLREHRIPRATADRFVLVDVSILAPTKEKRLTEAISASTEEMVHLLFERVLPRLRSILKTQEAVFLFVCELICGLPGIPFIAKSPNRSSNHPQVEAEPFAAHRPRVSPGPA